MQLDTAVLMLFFIRDDTFAKVFERVREMKPKRLYLFQDGPREGRGDEEKIERCRKICENIDWDCEVFRNYQEKNLGCDPSEYASISWAVERAEKLIILEDDDVPSKSFFRYCDELLNKYRDDKRVFMICGRNQLGEVECDSSYFFTKSDSIWGWATWKDRWEKCDTKHEFLLDRRLVKKIIKNSPSRFDGKLFIKKCRLHREKTLATGKPASYETPIRAAMYLNDTVSAEPRVNLINNIGITGDSEHTMAGIENIPKEQRSIYLIDACEMEFPLKHPEEFEENKEFLKKRNYLLGRSSMFTYYYRKIRGRIRKALKRS